MPDFEEFVIVENTDGLKQELESQTTLLNKRYGLVESSLIHLAAEKGKVASLATLISLGANVNANDKEKCSPLQYASLRGHASAVEMLLAKGAKVDHADGSGATAVHWSAGNDKKDILVLLLDHANAMGVQKELINRTDNAGETALHAACRVVSSIFVQYAPSIHPSIHPYH